MNSLKKNIRSIYFANFFISFSYGMFLLLPFFINAMGGNELISGKLLLTSGIGTIICVYISKFLLHKMGGHILGVVGSVLYALGSTLIIFQNHLGPLLIISVVCIGAGWGVCYNCAPYCLSTFVEGPERAKAFNYLSAFGVLGTGMAPTLVNVFGFKANFHAIFICAVVTSLVAAYCYSLVKNNFESLPQSSLSEKNTTRLKSVQTNAIFPLIMVFLGACAFTVLMNFQATYAQQMNLDYAIFYFMYSLSVVGGRFFISPFITKYNRFAVTIFLVLIMLFGLICFRFVASHAWLYPCAAILFGLGYGLIYPHIQAIAVASVTKEKHKDIISYFSLSYFLAVYAFPLIAGNIIVKSGYETLIMMLIIIVLVDLTVSIVQFLKLKNIGDGW